MILSRTAMPWCIAAFSCWLCCLFNARPVLLKGNMKRFRAFENAARDKDALQRRPYSGSSFKMRCAPSGNHRGILWLRCRVFLCCYCLFSSIIFSIFTFPNADTRIQRTHSAMLEGNSLHAQRKREPSFSTRLLRNLRRYKSLYSAPDYSRAHSTSASLRLTSDLAQAFSSACL